MSRDIRSFFISKKLPKPKEEDDDVIPESPDVQIKNKKKESRKRRVLHDDSDEEIFPSKKKGSSGDKNKSSSFKNKHKSPAKYNLVEVKAADLFGGPIKRTDPLVTKAKKINTEVGIHSDEEFDKSLLELDIINDQKNDASQNNDTKNSEAVNTVNEESTNQQNQLNIISNEENKATTLGKPTPQNIHIKKQIDISKDKNNDKRQTKIKNEKSKDETDRQTNFNKFIQDQPTADNQYHKEHKNKKEVAHNTSEHKKIKKEKKKNETERIGNFNEVRQERATLSSESYTDEYRNNKIINGIDNHKKIKKETSKDGADRKRDFSEFIANNEDVTNDTGDNEPKGKKRKLNKSLNESALTDEEKHERRLQSAASYQKYLNRSGPKHLGSKEIPEGSPNCLRDCAFLLTGVLDSFERDEIAAAITKYGGCIKNSMSKKVTHVLAGEEAGPAKLAKAQDLGIRIINEDEFLKMIRGSPKKTSNHNHKVKKEIKSEKKSMEFKNNTKDEKVRNRNNKTVQNDERVRDVKEENSSKDETLTNGDMKEKKLSPKDTVKVERKVKSVPEIKPIHNETKETKSQGSSPVKSEISSSLMWVDKYKPQNLKQIIGQHGDASNVKKLSNWLTKWYVNRKAKLPKPSPWAKNDDGGYYKAALLSGPPGIGKTTTVSLVCKELGFDAVEFNASDTRSKSLIKQQIGELLNSTSLSAYAKGDTGKQAVTKKHVLVMDEVDGMAGNEDRGGLQELIALIKSTSVPIVCMCNDRTSPKMRSLVNYCYDLRFSRPRVDQIKSAMLSICYKEGVKIPPDTLARLITAAGQDVRQTLHALSMWAADTDKARDADRGRKDVRMGPWEAIRKVFTAEEHKTMSLNDKSDLFFTDYSLMPLFVQENYLSVVPHCNKKEILDRISKAADSISLGDLVDARIRSNQAWSLLPLQAMYSSVIPGHELSGHVAGQIQFPGWLGKNSRKNKMHRLCQEIHAHTRLTTSGSKSSIYLDYAAHLRDAVFNPLIKDRSEGIAKSLEVLENYHLLREDLDSLTELSLWPGQRNPSVLVDAKVKAAMTRTYNKQASALPYAPGAVRKGRVRDVNDDVEQEDDDDDDDGQDNDDPENDALIKKKITKNKEKAGSSKEKAGSSKDKAGCSKEKKKKK